MQNKGMRRNQNEHMRNGGGIVHILFAAFLKTKSN